jgi:hypothetical protein
VDEILPSSRLERANRGKGKYYSGWSWMVPVFCAMCGTEWGHVPEEFNTFDCWLCNECAEKYGDVLGAYLMPDEVMQQAIANDLAEKRREAVRKGEV